MTSALISTDELQRRLPDVKLLDASYGPAWTENGPRIGNARFFDIDAIADPDAALPHTLPSAEIFAQMVGKLGIGNKDTVVIYDRAGISMAASRCWWMFRVFGHESVFILDGGLPKWQAEGRAVQTATPPAIPVNYHARYRPDLVRNIDQMMRNIITPQETILDARSAERFYTAQGHIPNSLNIPYMSLVKPDGTLRPADELKAIMTSGGADLSGKITATCGSGITACVVALALYELGRDDIAVYDGSWTEWAQSPNTPKVTSACQEKKAN